MNLWAFQKKCPKQLGGWAFLKISLCVHTCMCACAHPQILIQIIVQFSNHLCTSVAFGRVVFCFDATTKYYCVGSFYSWETVFSKPIWKGVMHSNGHLVSFFLSANLV